MITSRSKETTLSKKKVKQKTFARKRKRLSDKDVNFNDYIPSKDCISLDMCLHVAASKNKKEAIRDIKKNYHNYPQIGCEKVRLIYNGIKYHYIVLFRIKCFL